MIKNELPCIGISSKITPSEYEIGGTYILIEQIFLQESTSTHKIIPVRFSPHILIGRIHRNLRLGPDSGSHNRS